MKQNIILGLFLISIVLFGNCKKDNSGITTSPDTLLYGKWQNDLITLTTYDSVNVIVHVDTIPVTDISGNVVSLIQQFSKSGIVSFSQDSLISFIYSYPFKKTGLNLKILEPDSIYSFNNQTISLLSSTSLTVYQIYNNATKVKQTQYWHRL